MADLRARLDPDGYVYLSSADAYKIPDDVWRTLQSPPYDGLYSPQFPKELRLSRVAASEATRWLISEGHRVNAETCARNAAPAPLPPGRFKLPECRVCGQPFPASLAWLEGQACPTVETYRDPETGVRALRWPVHVLSFRHSDRDDSG